MLCEISRSIIKNYRFNISKSCDINLGYTKRINNIKTFNSNINGSSFNFYNSVGLIRMTSTKIKPSNKKLNDILGVRYIINCGDNSFFNSGRIC